MSDQNLIEYQGSISPNEAVEFSQFGSEIKFNNQNLYIGAQGNIIDSNFPGCVYEFKYELNQWIENNIIERVNGETGEMFGRTFELVENMLVVSAYNNVYGGLGAGHVFVYNYSESYDNWNLYKPICPSDLSSGDRFSSFLAVSNEFIFASSPLKNNIVGSAYIFDLCDSSLHSNFVANIRSGDSPVIVQFTSAAQGNPNLYEWDFNNDGTIDSVEENPQFTYQIDGLYSVSLTVHDEESSDMALKENYIQVTSDVIYGDLDNSGSLDVNDLVIFVAIILGDLEPDDSQLLAGDVNYSGEIDILDVVIAVDVILGLE